jgi:hypothetical protein
VDVPAELTLQIACFLQSDGEVPTSPREWFLVPGHGGRPGTFAAAAARLAALPKPVVVGALDQPGYVAVWRPDALEAGEQGYVEHTLRNQQAWLTRMLEHLGCGEGARIVFEGWGARVEVPTSEVHRWLGEYALTWGWTLGPPTDASHQARLLVLQGGRRWSPGGGCALPAAT